MKNLIFFFLFFVNVPLFLKAQCTPVANSTYPGMSCSVSTTGKTITVSVAPTGPSIPPTGPSTPTFCAFTDNIEITVTLSSTGSGTTITSSGGTVGTMTLAGGTGTGNLTLTAFATGNGITWTSGTSITLASFTLSGTSTGPITAGVSTYVELSGSGKSSNCSSGSITLPLDIVTFEAQSTGKTTLLKWLTASEINMESFNIERSAEGKTFEKVGNVKSAGTSKGAYAFTDEVPLSGVNYYRLKMINTDGSFTYSPVRSVVLAEGKTTNVSVVPNPAKEQVYVKLNVQEAKTITLMLVDITGKTLMTERKTLGSGFNELSLNLNNYPQGLYFLKIVDAQTTETHRLVIAK
jgi:Secretion system C-terminal sorting domain